MRAYLVRRLALAIPTVLGVVTLVFALIHLVPGDPVDVMLGETAAATDRAQLRSQLGLDRPLWLQYVRFVRRAALGNLGRSLHSGRPVSRLIAASYPATLELAAFSLMLATTIAAPLGIGAAARPHSPIDVAARTVAVVSSSIPSFWLGPLLVLVFSIGLDWTPVSGRGGLEHLLLPGCTLGLGLSATLTRMLRATLRDRLHDDYIRTARAKGASEGRVFVVHALRNAALPLLTVLGLQAGALLAGALITETIFAWPGLGRLMVQAIQTRDYPLVQGCVLVIALSYVLINLGTDLLYACVDPRVRID